MYVDNGYILAFCSTKSLRTVETHVYFIYTHYHTAALGIPRYPALRLLVTRLVFRVRLSVSSILKQLIQTQIYIATISARIIPRQFWLSLYMLIMKSSDHRRRSSVNFGGGNTFLPENMYKNNRLPEFYMIFARKNIFHIFGGFAPAPPSPTPMVLT